MSLLHTILRITAIGLCLASAFLLQGCDHRPSVNWVASHQVTVSRSVSSGNLSALTGTLDVEGEGDDATFFYGDRRIDGSCFEVTIKNDEVTLNGEPYGKLRKGDSVRIGDDGVTVNNMDYSESEKYLKANGSQTSAVTLSHGK